MKTIEVVAAIIISPEKEVLIAQRNLKKKFGGKWEFAGGKIEIGETHEEALHRELREELGISANIGKIFKTIHHQYPDFNIIMHFYFVEFPKQEIKLLDHQTIKWVSLNEILKYDFVDADILLVMELKKHFNI